MNGSHPTPERLESYVLDELEDAARSEVAAHLQVCSSCRESVAKLTVALAAYRSVDPVPADNHLLDRLLSVQRSRGSRSAFRSPRRFVNVAAAVAAAAVVFLGGFWTGRNGVVEPEREAISSEAATPATITPRPDRNPPSVRFAVADADHLAGLAIGDTTWN